MFSGESRCEPGTKEFIEDYRRVVAEDDLFEKRDAQRFLPAPANRRKVLDLGCGPGLFTIELARIGCEKMVAADLTEKALELTGKHCELYGIECELRRENAESLSFDDNTFSHVNCLGVIHHTPDTEACIEEIARVLAADGTATISVYYRNIYLKAWPLLRWAGKLLHKSGAGLRGRGRENIYAVDHVDEIVRLYDGVDNPIGKAYSRTRFIRMLSPFFRIEDLFLHFFPARTLPFRLPRPVHKLLARYSGFMICANVRKRGS